MNVTCNLCGVQLKIPDEKLPPNQVASITCPKCKGKITIDTRKSAEKSASGELEETEQDRIPIEFFEEGTKLALVLNGDEMQVHTINRVLEALSYKPIGAPSIREALGKLRLYRFDLIILSDAFDGQPIENSPVMNYLNNLSMSVRRKTFLLLLSERFKTMDNLTAFSLSADLVVNPADLSKLNLILSKSIPDREKFYKVFTDALKDTGKE